MNQPDPAPLWSVEAFERSLLIETEGTGKLSAFASLCWLCGFPTARYAPAGRTWGCHCRHCGARSFVGLPRFFYAPSAILTRPLERGLPELGAFLRTLDQLGAGFLDRTRFETVAFGGKTRVQLRAPVANLWTGDVGGSARVDKNGLPYVSADPGARQFLRSPANLRMLCGWTSWLQSTPGAADGWLDAWRIGTANFRNWFEQGRVSGARVEAELETQSGGEASEEAR